jgi:hypothetical protein
VQQGEKRYRQQQYAADQRRTFKAHNHPLKGGIS